MLYDKYVAVVCVLASGLAANSQHEVDEQPSTTAAAAAASVVILNGGGEGVAMATTGARQHVD